MKKNLSSIFLSVTLICNFVYAETIKSANKNLTMTDEEFMKQFMALEQQEQEQKKLRTKLLNEQNEAKAKTKAIEKLGKTLDELEKQLGIKQ